MKCPQCNYPQICPCSICQQKSFQNYLPWIWIDEEYIRCNNCYLTKSIDWWEIEAEKQ
ncbi:MAG TPA: hypothetical protein PLJ37_00595 [Chitinophagales bacterium]|nr:hypothetical protein [Chitinophagales bacterium]